MITLLHPKQIRTFERIKDFGKVDNMADSLMNCETLPPVTVREHGKGQWWNLQNGHHRLEAHKRCGLMIAAEVINR